MRDFGGMVTICLNTDLEGSKKFLMSCKTFLLAESLGGVESLIECPALMTHTSVAPERRLSLGITDNLIRISVGIEDVEDLLEDLEQALDAI